MPIHRLQGPDGKIHRIEAPAGTPPEELIAFLGNQLSGAAKPPKAPEDESYLSTLGRAVRRGGLPTIEKGLAAILETAPEAVAEVVKRLPGTTPAGGELATALGYLARTSEPYRELTQPAIQATRESAEETIRAAGPRQYKGVLEEESPMRALASAGESLAESALPVVAGIGTGLVTRNPLAAGAVMTGGTVPMAYGGIRERQQAEGIDDVGRAVMGTAVSSALDILTGVGGKIVRSATPAIREALEAGLRQAITRVAQTGISEAGTEALQTVVEQVAGGTDPTTKQSMLEALEGGLVGALGGTVFGGAIEGGTALARRRAPTEEGAVEPEATAEPTAPPSGDLQSRIDAYRSVGFPQQAAEETALADITREVALQKRETEKATARAAAAAPTPVAEQAEEPARRELQPISEKTVANARNQVQADVMLFGEELLRQPTEAEIEEAARALAQDPSYAAIDLINAVMETADRKRPPVEEAAPVEAAPVEEAAPVGTVGPAAVESRRAARKDAYAANGSEAGASAFDRTTYDLMRGDPVEFLAPDGDLIEITRIGNDEFRWKSDIQESVFTEAQVRQLFDKAQIKAEQLGSTKKEALEKAAPVEPDSKLAKIQERKAAQQAELRTKAQEVQRLSETLGGEPLTVVKGTKIIRGDISEGTRHEVELSDGTKVYMYRDTDQFGTSNPVWYVEDPLSTEKGGWEGYTGSLGSTKKEALEKVAAQVARGRQNTLEMTTPVEATPVEAAPVAEAPAVDEDLESDELSYDAVAEEIDSALESGEIDERAAAILRNRIDRAMDELLAGGTPRFAPADIMAALGEVAGEPTVQAAPVTVEEMQAEATPAEEAAPEAPAQRTVIVVHGGSDFETIDPSKFGTGEPGGIRPLGNGLYGFVVDSTNTDEIAQAVDFARHYAEKYGRGKKAIHAFQLDLEGADTGFNGPIIESLRGQAGPERQRLDEAYARRDVFPSGSTEWWAATDEVRAAERALQKAQAARFERLPVGLTEVGVTDTGRLKRIGKISVEQSDQDLIKIIQDTLSAPVEATPEAPAAPEAAAPPPPPPPPPPPSGGGPSEPTPAPKKPKKPKAAKRTKAQKVVDRAPLNTAEANAKINNEMNAYKAQVQTQFSLDAAGLLDPISEAYSEHKIKDTPGVIKGMFNAFRNGDLDEANLRAQLIYLPTRELLEYADLLSGVPEKALKPMRKARKIKDQGQGMRNTMLNAGGRLLDDVYKFIGSPKRGGTRKASALYATMDISRTLSFNPAAHASLEAALNNDGIMEHARDKLASAKREQERGKARKQLKEREAMIRKGWQYWEALGKFKGGQQMFRELVDYYANVTRAFRTEIDGIFRKLKTEGLIGDEDIDALSDVIGRADETVDKAIKAAHEGELFDDVPSNKFPVVYVPWNRFGQYVLQVKPEFGGITGGQRYQFETREERETWARQLAKQLGVDPNDGNVFDRHASTERAKRDDANEHSVLQEILKIIRNPKVPLNIDVPSISDPSARQQAVRDFRASIERELTELVLTALPEESIRKQFIKAKGVTGRDINHDRVLAHNIQRYANQLPRLKYGYQLETAISEANDELEGASDSKGREMAEILLDELGTRLREGLDPPLQNALISVINNFAHTMLLSAPASAITNGIAIWQRVLPELGVNYGTVKAANTLRKLEGVTRLMGSIEDDPSGNVRNFIAPSLIKLPYIKDNPTYRKAFFELRDNYNAFGQNFVQQVIVGQRNPRARARTATQTVRHGFTKIAGLINAPFSTVERITNEKAGMAAFILEYEKQKAAGKTDKEAYDAGVNAGYEIISNAIGRYDPSERPPLFKGLGSLLLVFKMYSMNMATYLMRQISVLMSAVPGMPGKSAFTKAERKHAFKLLAGIYAGNALFTGVAGTFGFSALVGAFAPLVFLLMDDDEREEWLRENPEYANDMPGYVIEKLIPEVFGGYGDLVAYGPVSALTGVNFSSRLGYDNLFFKDPVAKTGDFAADTKTWFMDNFGAGISRADDFLAGVGAFMNGDYRNAIRGIAPAAVNAPLKSEEALRKGIVTAKGYTTVPADEITVGMAAALALGYQPLGLSKTYARLYGASEQLQAIKAEERKLLRKLNRAREENDYEAVEAAREDIDEFNDRYPGNRIDRETIKRSERAYESRMKRLYRGVEFKPEDRERIERDVETYWGDQTL